MKTINSKVVLEDGKTYRYSCCQMFTDGSYVLSVLPLSTPTEIKEEIAEHVLELHNIEIAAICGVE